MTFFIDLINIKEERRVKMKTKQKVDITAAILFLLNGVVLLLCPICKITNLNHLFIMTMSVYTIVNLGKFILTRETKDFEGILLSLASLIIGSVAFFYNTNQNPTHLAILLFVWIILVSLVKLKKADYYNDRKSKLWILEICFLIIFILIGILTAMNLNYTDEIKILLLGFFFFTHGILELIDPIIIYLTKERIK